MSTVPKNQRYTTSHEWVKIEGDTATIGITDHAQAELGEIVFIEPPTVGQVLSAGDALGTVESVKAVSEVYTPVSGEVVSVNDTLVEDPEQLNESPYGDGWIVRIRVKDPSEAESLLDADAYQALLSNSE